MTDTETPDSTAPVKKKLFQKPAWLIEKQNAKRNVKGVEQKNEGTDLFSRSRDSHKDIVAEQERRRKLRAEKKARLAQDESTENSAKRRRVSTEAEDADVVTSDRKRWGIDFGVCVNTS
jgi:hypothetical protein